MKRGFFGPVCVRLMACAMLAATALCGCSAGAPEPTEPAATVQKDIEGRYIQPVFADLDVSKDLKYATKKNESGEQEDLLLDIYQPRGDTLAARPAVIFVHGGGFTSGDKSGGIEQQLAERLARKGYVTLSINYRLRANPSADWPGAFADSTADAYSALEWLAAHKDEYRVDIGHVAFGGHSAGANIVAELCYSDWGGRPIKKSSVFAAIVMAGPQMIRGGPRADDPYGIVIHGEKDELVPFSLSEGLIRTFEAAGTRYVFDPIPDAYHNLTPAINEVEDVVTQNLYKALTGKDAGIKIRFYADERKATLARRLAERPTIDMQRIDAVIDGKLDDWAGIDPIALTGIKDAGTALPPADDFSAEGRIAWDRRTGRVCMAVAVTDDVLQVGVGQNLWENDSVELLLDLSDETTAYPVLQWIVSANGKDVYCSGSTGSYQAAVVRSGNRVVYELAVDVGKMLPEIVRYDLRGKTIGASVTCNDGEEGQRQLQIGLVAGETWNSFNFANLRFGDD